MLNKVPKDFTFFVKAHRELIHVRKKAQETLPRFHEMLKAYQRKQKLAGGAFQFPANFECDGREEDYLRWFTESWGILIP